MRQKGKNTGERLFQMHGKISVAVLSAPDARLDCRLAHVTAVCQRARLRCVNSLRHFRHEEGKIQIEPLKAHLWADSVRSGEKDCWSVQLVDEAHRNKKWNQPDGELRCRGCPVGLIGHSTDSLCSGRGEAEISFILADRFSLCSCEGPRFPNR